MLKIVGTAASRLHVLHVGASLSALSSERLHFLHAVYRCMLSIERSLQEIITKIVLRHSIPLVYSLNIIILLFEVATLRATVLVFYRCSIIWV